MFDFLDIWTGYKKALEMRSSAKLSFEISCPYIYDQTMVTLSVFESRIRLEREIKC